MAIFYIDPSRSVNGDGTEPSPFNAWASVTWTAGNRYLQKAGTNANEQVSPNASGTASAPIYIGKYGEEANPKVGIGQTHGLYFNAVQHFVVENIDVESCTSHGVYIRASGATTVQNFTFNRVKSNKNGRNGFYFDSIVLDGTIQNVTLKFCSAEDNGEHGFDNLGIVKNVLHYWCTARRNGKLILGHGFSIHPFASTSVTSGWDQSGGETGNVYGRTLSANEDVQKVINRTDGVILTKNAGAGTGITANQWDQTSTRLRINVSANPNTKTIGFKRAPHGPFFYFWCTSEYNSTLAGPGEGHGFASDDMTGPSNYFGCLAQYNEGAGIQSQWTVDVQVVGCVTRANNLSNFRTTGYTERLKFYNNTSLESKQYGLFAETPFSNLEIINNLCAFNGVSSSSFYGIGAQAAGSTASNNLTFGNGLTGTNHTLNVTNTNGSTVNPNLKYDFVPTTASVIIGGTYLGTTDFYGNMFKSPSAIGAIQPFSGLTISGVPTIAASVTVSSNPEVGTRIGVLT